MSTALDKIIQARTNLILDEPFFGSLALRLKLKEDPSCKTFWTDGTTMGFNPKYLEEITLAEAAGVTCHEVLHVADGHPWRRSGRHFKTWNEACDYAINPIIKRAGLALPSGTLYDPQFDGQAAETVFSKIFRKKADDEKPPPSGPESPSSGASGDGPSDRPEDGKSKRSGETGGVKEDSADSPESPGEVRDAPIEDDQEARQAEWKVAVLQAAQAARMAGKLPSGVERIVEDLRRTRVDWKSALRRFVQMRARADYSWTMPNIKFMASGIYLPQLRSESMPAIVIGADSSGSCWAAQDQFAAEVNEIIEECKPEKVYVVYADAKVQSVEEFEPGDPITLTPKGGGGTSFVPVFDWVREQGLDPACLIYLTDMEGRFPNEAPDYPVLWASILRDKSAPFGEMLFIDLED